MHCDSAASSCAGVKPTRATGARTIVSLSLPKDGHSGAASCWTAGAISDTCISVQLWPIPILTWRIARTRASSWPDRQPPMLPGLIVLSLFRGVMKRAGTPATTEAVRAVSFDRVWFCCGSARRKLLARKARWRQARCAMSTFARSNNYGRALLAALVSVAFLWALALSSSSQLHQRVHKDAGLVEHNCLATM